VWAFCGLGWGGVWVDGFVLVFLGFFLLVLISQTRGGVVEGVGGRSFWGGVGEVCEGFCIRLAWVGGGGRVCVGGGVLFWVGSKKSIVGGGVRVGCVALVLFVLGKLGVQKEKNGACVCVLILFLVGGVVVLSLRKCVVLVCGGCVWLSLVVCVGFWGVGC